jgi:Family of unknown function (DUF5675)
MKMILERLQIDPDVTIGALSIDGDFECWVCEDVVREIDGQPVTSWKVPSKTAIPYGTYKVDITMSARFKRLLPLLLDVPCFAGIRIHPGNTAADTEGCLLPGLDRMAKSVGRSRVAFESLFMALKDAKNRAEPISIEITRT